MSSRAKKIKFIATEKGTKVAEEVEITSTNTDSTSTLQNGSGRTPSEEILDRELVEGISLEDLSSYVKTRRRAKSTSEKVLDYEIPDGISLVYFDPASARQKYEEDEEFIFYDVDEEDEKLKQKKQRELRKSQSKPKKAKANRMRTVLTRSRSLNFGDDDDELLDLPEVKGRNRQRVLQHNYDEVGARMKFKDIY